MTINSDIAAPRLGSSARFRLARWAAATALGLASLAASRPASANPRPLPFSYPYQTLPEGEAELEQYVDATPVRVPNALWSPNWAFQTELEYGISDRLELGLYVVGKQAAGDAFRVDGTKQRLRLRLAEEGQWPVDTALYFEVSELSDELEVEQKLILQRRFGPVRAIANLWFEQSLENYRGELESKFNPTGGLAVRVSPNAEIGAEYWARIPFENEKGSFDGAMHHFAGPTASLQWGKIWWSTGVYKRLDHMSRAVEVGDKYGQVWVRSVVGVSL
jgi:hypothetical protein